MEERGVDSSTAEGEAVVALDAAASKDAESEDGVGRGEVADEFGSRSAKGDERSES